MKQCPYCGQANRDDRENCHFCGGPLPIKTDRLEQAYTSAVNAIKSSMYSLPSSDKIVTIAMSWPVLVKSRSAYQLHLPLTGVLRNIWIDARPTPNVDKNLVVFSRFPHADDEMRANVWTHLTVNHNGLYLFNLPILEPVTCVSDLGIDTMRCIDVVLELSNAMDIDLHAFVIASQSVRTT